MEKEPDEEKVKNSEHLENSLAKARLGLAQQILQADNAPRVLEAMNDLCATYIAVSENLSKTSSGKLEAKKLNKAADEFFTVLMCAMYNKMNTRD